MNYITRGQSEFQVPLNFLNFLFRMFNYITLQYSFSFQIHSRLRFFIQLQILNNQGQVSLELTSFFRFSSFLSLKATPFSHTIMSEKKEGNTLCKSCWQAVMVSIMKDNVSKLLEKSNLNVYRIIYITLFIVEFGGKRGNI